MFRKVPVLPIVFRGGGSGGVDGHGGVGDGLYSVGGGVAGVSGHVGGCDGLTSGTGGSSGGSFIGVAGSGVDGDCGDACRTHPYLAARPCSRRLDSFPRAVVLRVLLLEVRQHTLGAVSGPERQGPVIPIVERLGVLSLH